MNRRKSNGDLRQTGRNVPSTNVEPLEPPARLSPEEREVWHETV
jgi:hypothetical protein